MVLGGVALSSIMPVPTTLFPLRSTANDTAARVAAAPTPMGIRFSVVPSTPPAASPPYTPFHASVLPGHAVTRADQQHGPCSQGSSTQNGQASRKPWFALELFPSESLKPVQMLMLGRGKAATAQAGSHFAPRTVSAKQSTAEKARPTRPSTMPYCPMTAPRSSSQRITPSEGSGSYTVDTTRALMQSQARQIRTRCNLACFQPTDVSYTDMASGIKHSTCTGL